ncbi:Uncharacterised protein [Porphyromonas cangingivalis]|nr:Uncharacterised protein [Porphyromonas cangingivalis]
MLCFLFGQCVIISAHIQLYFNTPFLRQGFYILRHCLPFHYHLRMSPLYLHSNMRNDT